MESVGTTASNPTNPRVEQAEVAPDSTEEPAQVGQYERKTKGMFMSLELAPTQTNQTQISNILTVMFG